MTLAHWLYFIAGFAIVIGILMIGAGIQQWLEWRKMVRITERDD